MVKMLNYFDLYLFVYLKAWSHRPTDMYRRENGLKYAEFGYPATKFISSATQSWKLSTSTGHVTGKTHVNRMYTG